MRVAYVTPNSCGAGHATRGAALVQAGARAGIELRAFGPPCPDLAELGYEGSDDWAARAATYAPDLLIGDLSWVRLDELRESLGVPAWLLVRWLRPTALLSHGRWSIEAWERRISIEPASDGILGITESISPIVVEAQRFEPVDGQELEAGYNSWWEAVAFGYRDRVRWVDGGSPERRARIDAGGDASTDGADVLMGMIRARGGTDG
jgi:hypothetical protein